MRIEFSTEGGLANFPGLAKPVVIDVDALDKEEAARLKRLVEDARFFDQPAMVSAPTRGAADYQYNVLAIDDGTRAHTVRILESAADPVLRDLVQAVRTHAKAARAAQRGNPAGARTGE